MRLAHGCALLLVLASRAVAQEQPGSIEGTAQISRRLVAQRPRVRVYGEPGHAMGPEAAPPHRFANVVLYLEGVRPTAAPPPRSAPSMRQRGEQFVPHVMAVAAGTTVEFPNDDALYHNVFSLSRVKSFDLGRYARGTSRSVLFPAAGVVQVFCHIHADMTGYILVFDHPWFAIPEADGRFRLDGVPPGDYRLVAWHERSRPVEVPVRVEPGRATRVGINIPLTDSIPSP